MRFFEIIIYLFISSLLLLFGCLAVARLYTYSLTLSVSFTYVHTWPMPHYLFFDFIFFLERGKTTKWHLLFLFFGRIKNRSTLMRTVSIDKDCLACLSLSRSRILIKKNDIVVLLFYRRGQSDHEDHDKKIRPLFLVGGRHSTKPCCLWIYYYSHE